ncbi:MULTISPECIES: NADH:flavin oxidoreductase [unclassified Pseudomonas]|uniref:NADH:flavin oxidoreductase n=1 Tax=unclassified Pseudomonas TaxID=196821 RepID=UPI000B8770D8|nr:MULTISPECIES: NADH:flavin oxidoreductase [unclassified Pseudomonas]
MNHQGLLQPLQVRGCSIPNRIVMSPMTRGFCPGGAPTAEVRDYYARRAQGGCGLIITEAVGVDHPSALGDAGLGEDNIPVLHGAKVLQGWGEVVQAVHAAGGKIVPQLWHQGVLRLPGTGPFPEAPVSSPSGIWGEPGQLTALAEDKIPIDVRIGLPMTEAEIEQVIDGYVRSAKGAMLAGFDGIAIHGAHGYLIDTFLWDKTNRRQDRWGGSRAARTRFAVEIIRRIRMEVGPDLPIFFRFSDWKQQDFRARLATTPQALEELLGPLADAGVDVFDASVRYFDKPAYEGSTLNLAGWAKKVTGKCAMTVGGVGINKGMYDGKSDISAVDNLERVMQRLDNGEFDLVGVGRALLGDPHWPRKIIAGEQVSAFHSAVLTRLT